MGPVTGLARLPWRILLCVNMGNFRTVDQEEFRKHNRNGGKYTYIVRDCHSSFYSCNFTNKANSHISKVEIHTRPKLCHFGGYVAKAKLFLSKKCRPGYRAEAFIWENVYWGYQYLGRKNCDLNNRASPAFHMKKSKFLQREEWRSEISETKAARLTGFI